MTQREKNEARARRGSLIINARLDSDPVLEPTEAAIEAIGDILHAICGAGDEMQADDIVERSVAHFVEECDEAQEEEETAAAAEAEQTAEETIQPCCTVTETLENIGHLDSSVS